MSTIAAGARQPPGDEHEGVDCRLIRPVRPRRQERSDWVVAEFVEHRAPVPPGTASSACAARIDLRRDVAQRTERERGHEVVTRRRARALDLSPTPSPARGWSPIPASPVTRTTRIATGRAGDGLVEHGQRPARVAPCRSIRTAAGRRRAVWRRPRPPRPVLHHEGRRSDAAAVDGPDDALLAAVVAERRRLDARREGRLDTKRVPHTCSSSSSLGTSRSRWVTR